MDQRFLVPVANQQTLHIDQKAPALVACEWACFALFVAWTRLNLCNYQFSKCLVHPPTRLTECLFVLALFSRPHCTPTCRTVVSSSDRLQFINRLEREDATREQQSVSRERQPRSFLAQARGGRKAKKNKGEKSDAQQHCHPPSLLSPTTTHE